MNNLDIAKGLIFHGLNTIKKETLADRVIIQKKIYLIQELGIDLGYSYNWYIKGPYSPDLTSYVYENLDELVTADFSKHTLTPGVLSELGVVNNLELDRPQNLTTSQWYELLASLHYIYKNFFVLNEEDRKKENLIIQLRGKKPQYTEEDCETAINTLEKTSFIGALS